MSSLGTMMDFPLTLDHLLVRAERMFPAVPVVSRLPDRSLHRTTYGQVAARARQLAEALARAGLRPGDRVATLMWNHAAHLETYLGVPLAGGVVHTLNLRLSPEELAFIVQHAADRFLLVDEALVPLWEKVRPRVSVETVVVVSAAQGGEYETLLATATGRWTPPRLAEGDPCGMCYTSGTTGQPKGVVYTPPRTMLHTLTGALPGRAVHPPRGRGDAGGAHVPRQRLGPAVRRGDDRERSRCSPARRSTPRERARSAVARARDDGRRRAHRLDRASSRRWTASRAAGRSSPALRLIVGGSAAPESLIRALRPPRHHRRPRLGHDRDVPAGVGLPPADPRPIRLEATRAICSAHAGAGLAAGARSAR